MSDDLLRHYEAEYAALGRLAAEFAEANPTAAARLRLARGEVDDPHVERLLEGVAFLGARVRQRLDDAFPELTDALLGVLYPHYLAPFPSCLMAQLAPRRDLQGSATVPQGTLVQTEAIDGTSCRFRTTAPVRLWPIEIETVRLAGLPLPSLPVRLANGAAGVLRITLRCTEASATFERLGLDRLRLHLRGGRQVSQGLYELLCSHVVAVAFADNAADPNPVVRPASAVQPAGFAPEEALLPWPAQGFAGFRLLAEYFAFPEKFLFVDIAGIDGKTLAGAGAGAGNRLELFLYLDQVPSELERAVDAGAFALGCVPLVNLFPQRCEPIDLDWTRGEYRVDPDLRRPASSEVWSVERVRETRPDGSQRPWRPFFRMVHGDPDGGQPGGSYLPIRRPSAGGLGGSDVFLAVDDPAFEADRSSRARLSVDALCTNRDLARRLPAGVGRPTLHLEQGSAVASGIAPLSPVTETRRPPVRGQRFWRLISHLSLSHLSVVGGAAGAEVLREVLRLYDLRNDAETQAVIRALSAVTAVPGAARLPGGRAGAFCRGLDVRLTFEAQAWQPAGLYLLGAVLARFLALHGTVNGFVRCTALLQGRPDPVARWPAMAGTRPLL
jgi:type VI secretion system protein ImpG